MLFNLLASYLSAADMLKLNNLFNLSAPSQKSSIVWVFTCANCDISETEID